MSMHLEPMLSCLLFRVIEVSEKFQLEFVLLSCKINQSLPLLNHALMFINFRAFHIIQTIFSDLNCYIILDINCLVMS